MRHLPDAPNGVMDCLFVQLMMWGKQQGYQWFDLGMAPLSGLAARQFAPLWNRLGGLIYDHGEAFYNFAGVPHDMDGAGERFLAEFDTAIQWMLDTPTD